MSILDLLKPKKKTSVLDLLEEEKPSLVANISKGVMGVAKAPIKAAQDIIKFQDPYIKAGFKPVEKVREVIGAGLKAMPEEVRDVLIPTIVPKQLPTIRKIEQEYIQDELFKFVASAPVNPLVLGTVAAELLTPAVGKLTISQRLAKQIETRQPKFNWKAVEQANVEQEILKTSERISMIERPKFIGQVKDFLSKTVKTINSPSTSNNLKWQLYNRYFKPGVLQESLLGKPQALPSLAGQRGSISIPSGKDISSLAKQFNLPVNKLTKAIETGVYTGLSGEVVKAIQKITPSKGGEIEPLIEEAKKYKSVEEFVEAQGITAEGFINKPEEYTKALLSDLKKGEPGISKEIFEGGQPGYVLRNKQGKPIGILKHDGKNITDIAVSKTERRKGHAKKLISEARKDNILGQKAPFTKESANLFIQQLTDIWNKAQKKPSLTPQQKLLTTDIIEGEGFTVKPGKLVARALPKGALELRTQVYDPVKEEVLEGDVADFRELERKAKEVMPRVKNITGQTKVGEVIRISEREALKVQLRKEAKASRTAYRTGRIEEKIKQLEKQEYDAKEQALIDETNQIIKNINRMPTHNMDIDYKDTIEGLKKQFDLKSRSSKTLIRREKLKMFIERQKAIGQPVNIPLEQIEMAYKTPLNDLMIDELREIDSTIKKLSYLGRTKSRLTKIRQDKNFQGVKSELIDTMHVKPMSESAVAIVKKTSPLEKMKGGKNTYLYSSIRPERLIEKLDGYQPFGSFWKTIYEPIDQSTNQEVLNFNAKRNQFLQFITDNDVDLVGLLDRQQEIIPKQLYLTGQTKIGIYLASHDEDQMRHLMMGGIDIDGKIFDFTPKMLRATIQSLTPQEKAVGDYLLNHYEEQYQGIDKVHVELYGEHLPKVEGYSPIRISGEEKIFEESLADEMLRRSKMGRLSVEKGFTKERAKGAAQAVKLDAIDGFVYNLQRVEHFKSFAPTIRDIRKVLYDSDIRSAIYQKRGKQFYKRLDNWVKNIANKTTGKDFSPLSKHFSILRSNSAISVLGWNLITAMKQPLSFSLAIAEAGLQPILSGMAQVTLHPKRVSEFVNQRDPQIKYRRVERDIREMIEQQGLVKTLKGVAGPKSLKFLMAMDRRTVLAIWKGVYDQELKKTGDEKLAIRRAAQVIRKTQPQSYAKDLAEFFRGGELERMFTMFQNQINQNVNYWEHDMFGKLLTKGTGVGPASFAVKFWWAYLLPAYLIGMVSRGRKPSPEELKTDLATYALMGLPFFGPLISAGLRGYGGVSLPLQVIEYGTDLIKSKKLATKLNILIKAGFAVKGIPYTQPRRVIRGIAQFEKHGVKGLIYGPRKDKKKKKTIMDLL